jgi:hypothetical protein
MSWEGKAAAARARLASSSCSSVVVVNRHKTTPFLQVRNAAGLLLKNNLKQQYATTTEDFRSYIKVCGGGEV